MQNVLVGMAMLMQAVGIIALLSLLIWAIGMLIKRFSIEHPLSAYPSGLQIQQERRQGERRHRG